MFNDAYKKTCDEISALLRDYSRSCEAEYKARGLSGSPGWSAYENEQKPEVWLDSLSGLRSTGDKSSDAKGDKSSDAKGDKSSDAKGDKSSDAKGDKSSDAKMPEAKMRTSDTDAKMSDRSAHRRTSEEEKISNTKQGGQGGRQLPIAHVTLVIARHRRRRTKGEPEKKPIVKIWRTEMPDAATLARLRSVTQNGPEWFKARAGSSGASGKATFLGWVTKYKLSWFQWLEDTGQIAEPSRTIEECFFADHGHAYENEARLIAECLLDATIEETGIWIHPKYPFSHASPDGLSTFSVQAAKALGNELERIGLVEIKCTIYDPMLNCSGIERFGFPHFVRPEYIIQMQDQAGCLNKPFVDLANYWHFNEKSSMRPLPYGPFEYEETKDGKLVPKTRAPSATSTTGQWQVAEMLITRMYASVEFQNWIYSALVKHKDFCEETLKRGVPSTINWQPESKQAPYHGPPIARKLSSPEFRIRPLLHAVFYLTGCPAHLLAIKELWDPADIRAHIGSRAPKPAGWLGAWPPELKCTVRKFTHIRPLTLTLASLEAMGEKAPRVHVPVAPQRKWVCATKSNS